VTYLIALALIGQIQPDDAELAKLCMVERLPARAERKRQIVQICDWHIVPPEAYASDLRSQDATITDDEIEVSYRELLAEVEAVQAEQRKLLVYLIERYDVQSVHVEGLTEADVPIYEAIARS
jgi:hypothetical protein